MSYACSDSGQSRASIYRNIGQIRDAVLPSYVGLYGTLAFGDDHWMNQPWVGSDLERLSLDFVRLASNKPEVPFSAEEEFSMHQETGSVDIYGSVIRGSGRHTPNATKGYLMLSDYCPSDTIPG